MYAAVEQLRNDFLQVANLAGAKVTEGDMPERDLAERDITFDVLEAPHSPPKELPAKKMGVYVFMWQGRCLKVGKVGPNSEARYTNQHYNPASSRSNLAKSVLQHKAALAVLEPKADLEISQLDETTVGDWVRRKTTRINFLLDQDCGVGVLDLLESFLQCRLRPMFEGFESQRRSVGQ